ncbi:MAG: hypothetical protein RR553_08570 [Akkermansia sp.]
MKLKSLTDNWQAKLICLLAAIGVWFLVKHYVSKDPEYRRVEIRRSHP